MILNELLNQMPLWRATRIKDIPLFDSIRDEPEFKQMVRNVEAKYQAEHERVRQWLEENDRCNPNLTHIPKHRILQ
jgi:hypothetical protein